MEESITKRIMNGEKIYPFMDGKVIGIKIEYDLIEHYKKILKNPSIAIKLKENGYKEITNFTDFKRLLCKDKSFLNIIKTYFNNESNLLISDKDGEKFFAIELKESEERPYTLHLVQLYCEMNRANFFKDYIDIFGNKITFK